jgi:5-methylcytosine-specific restriction protein B
MFSWIPIYTELAKKILPFRNRQSELIQLLKELGAEGIPAGSTFDKDDKGAKIPLTSIDPFTFYSCFNRGLTKENRCKILAYFKAKLQLQSEVPTDFDGIPVVSSQAAWFFPYQSERKPDDIPSLWTLAESVVAKPPEELDPKLFERCLQILSVGPAKLTMGMFWLNPKHYIACDANNRELFERNGINGEIKNLSMYRQLIKQVNEKLGTDYPQISSNAVKSPNKVDKQYWAGSFQWGETSKLEEFIQGNFWQLGWDKNEQNPAAKKNWDYFQQVKVGDEFAIKGLGGRNDLRVHYIGEVTGKTEDGVLKLQKLDRPLYKDKGPKGLTGATWFDTLVPIKSQEIIGAIFHGEQLVSESEKESSAIVDIASGVNVILYGPPGTGKTYETIERSVKLIAPGFSGDHAAHKRTFDDMRREGRVEFITFHQSYSYEDFIEGIRPVVDVSEEGGSPRYECRPGAFKRLACNALFDCLETAEAAKQLVPFDVLWKALLSQIESDPEAKYPGLSEKTSYQFTVTPKGNLEGVNIISDKRFLCSRKILEQVFNAKRSQNSVTVSDVMEVVARGCHSQLVAAVFNELRRVEKSQFAGKAQPEQHTAYSEEEKAEAVQRYLADGEKSGYQLKPESQWNQYVLVIDEINRGNISKILGELITLIEPDKRLRTGDNQNTLVVTLPYSGERFAVPANLHVLATMNTADKSIALVDVALRRRFDFKELAVDLSVCKQLTGSMRSALQELNRRIVLRKDRDHQIGHAYFVSVADDASFNQRFRSQIIPLLQEYFYNDWEGLRYILGENSTAEGLFIRKVSGSEVKEARTKWQWFFDAGTDGMNCLEALCGNYQIV